MSKTVVNHIPLKAFARNVFQITGLPLEHADIVASALVASNLRGQDGHGVSRIPMYCKRIRAGIVNPQPNVQITKVANAAAHCDGDNGMGFVVATKATLHAIDIAKENGIGLVGVKNSTHFGSSSFYVQQALDADMISLVFTNSSPAYPPWGGAKPFLGTSPIACGIPAGQEHPFLMDMATTIIARGKLRLAAQRGEKIPENIGLDKNGVPTTDGMEAFNGVTLPFGGVKGAAIGMMMDLLCGCLTGAHFAGNVSSLYNDFSKKQNVGHFILVIRPDLFMPIQEFKDRMDFFVRTMRSQPKMKTKDDPTKEENIYMVGEPETLSERMRLESGIPIQNDVLEQLRDEAKLCNVDFPF